MLNAVIYTRVSDPSQIENNSLDTQEITCRGYAKNNNLEVVNVFREEGKSAKEYRSRTELNRLLSFCAKKQNQVSTVIVYKIDRFSRDLSDGLELIAILSKYGVKVLSATEGYEENSIGRAIRNIMLVVGQLDNEQKGERVKHNMQAVFRDGLWPFKSPIGYKRKYKTKEQNKGLPPVTNKNLAPIITKMFRKASEGIYSKAQLARIMNIDGFKDFYGKPATHKVVDKILNKTFYYGLMYANKWDESVWGKHEPIIDKKTWEKAYQKVILKKKNVNYKDTSLYPLKGTIHCDLCNEAMTTSPSRGRHGIVYYYECKGCRKLRANLKDAHQRFIDKLKEVKPSKTVLKLFNYMVFKEWDNIINESRKEAEKIEERIASLKKELQSVRKAVDNEIYTQKEAKEETGKLRQDIAVLEVEKTDVRIEQYDKEAVKNFTEHFLLNLDVLWQELDLPKRQALQEKIFPNGIYWTKDKEIRTPNLSPSFELIHALGEAKGENVTPRGIEPRLPG